MQRRTITSAMALGAAIALTLSGCSGGSGFSDNSKGSADSGELTNDSSRSLSVMIGSSGDSETKAVQEAVAAWSQESGVKAEVIAASDLNQQLSQGFAASTPPDVFYLSTDSLAGFAENGSVLAYGDRLSNKDDFYPSLVSNFTYDGDFYCAPKDFSTLALFINNEQWAAAGLTDQDYPTTWDELETVATKLTGNGHTGLSFGAEYQRLGAFMAQAGGTLLTDDQTKAVADSEENVAALTEVKELLASGNTAYAADLGAGWGGEAFGTGKAAMVIEGNWLTGTLSSDYPDLEYTVVELPAGPGGKGTLQFSKCWGIATDSPSQQQSLDLVEYLTATDQQLGFSKAFGVMPSVESAADAWTSANPDKEAFLKGADYAKSVPTLHGSSAVIEDFNAQIEGLSGKDPKEILSTVQSNFEAIVK